MILDLIPAYGRNYPPVTHALQAWEPGADFKIHNGPYCSSRDQGQMIARGIHRVRFWGQTTAKRWIVLGEVELQATTTTAPTTTPEARVRGVFTVGAVLAPLTR